MHQPKLMPKIQDTYAGISQKSLTRLGTSWLRDTKVVSVNEGIFYARIACDNFLLIILPVTVNDGYWSCWGASEERYKILTNYTVCTIIPSVDFRKLRVTILARSFREMSLTVRIVWKYILSRVCVSVWPSICLIREKHPKPQKNWVASACLYFNGQRPALLPAEQVVTVGRQRIAITCTAAMAACGRGSVCAWCVSNIL